MAMTKATRRRKSMKGCGKCGKSRCIHKKRSTNKRGGCGTCQTGGNVIFTPTPTIVGTIVNSGVNVLRVIQGLAPI